MASIYHAEPRLGKLYRLPDNTFDECRYCQGAGSITHDDTYYDDGDVWSNQITEECIACLGSGGGQWQMIMDGLLRVPDDIINWMTGS